MPRRRNHHWGLILTFLSMLTIISSNSLAYTLTTKQLSPVDYETTACTDMQSEKTKLATLSKSDFTTLVGKLQISEIRILNTSCVKILGRGFSQFNQWSFNPDNWWNSTWNTCRNITVTNNQGLTFNNSAIPINITFATNSSSGGDIRFVSESCNNGGYAIPHWQQNRSADNWYYEWVAVNMSSSATPFNISVYYNSSNTTTDQSGNLTFRFFDDFSGTSESPHGWVAGSCNGMVETGGYGLFSPSGASDCIYYVNSSLDLRNISVVVSMNTTTAVSFSSFFISNTNVANIDDNGATKTIRFDSNILGRMIIGGIDDTAVTILSSTTYPQNYGLTTWANNLHGLFINNTGRDNGTTTFTLQNGTTIGIYQRGNVAEDWHIDYVFVYNTTNASVSVEGTSQQSPSGGGGGNVTPASNGTFWNYTYYCVDGRSYENISNSTSFTLNSVGCPLSCTNETRLNCNAERTPQCDLCLDTTVWENNYMIVGGYMGAFILLGIFYAIVRNWWIPLRFTTLFIFGIITTILLSYYGMPTFLTEQQINMGYITNIIFMIVVIGLAVVG